MKLGKVFIVVAASLLPLLSFAQAQETGAVSGGVVEKKEKKEKLEHFLGGALYYDYGKVFLETNNLVVAKSKPNWLGVGLSYDLLLVDTRFHFQVNAKYSGVYGEDIVATDGSKFFSDVGVDALFNYFINVKQLNKQSGFFVGGGVGMGNVYTMQNPTGPDILVLNSFSRYVSLIGDVGFMHTLDDIPLMWNLAFSYKYNMAIHDYNSVKLQNFDSTQLKFGLYYAFR